MKTPKWMMILLLTILIQSCMLSLISIVYASPSTDQWTMFRHDSSHSGYIACSVSMSSTKLLWNFTTMKAVVSSPAVANGAVFVGCRDGAVYSINSSTGELLWYYYSDGSEINSSPAIYNNSIYVGSDNGNIYSLDIDTGTPLWTSPVGGLVQSSPTIVGGYVYIGSRDHDMFCLNASDGVEIWKYPTSKGVRSSPAFSDGSVFFATDDFHVYALNASTGSKIWRTHTGSVSSSPSTSNGAVYIGSTDGYICSLNASTGAKIWEYLTGGSVSSSPAVAYGCVYIGSDDNNVYCINASNGKRVWQSPTGYWVRSSPAISDGNVYVGSEDHNLYCFDAFTGTKKWSYETQNFVDSSPAIVNGTLYIGSSDHNVYAFALGDSADALPSQSLISSQWTTITFNIIACTVMAAIIFTLIRFVLSKRLIEPKVKTKKISTQNLPWLSQHTDILCILAILAFSSLFFVNLGSAPLWEADEQTYSQWAFHMFKTGDYVTPWAFGDLLLWIGKPPLFMWLVSLAYQIFGVTNFAARFWSAVFGTLSLVLVFYLGKKLYNLHVGFISAFVLGTFTTFYVFARHSMLDISIVFFILTSIYFLLSSEKAENTNKYISLGGLFFGLAMMIKQVVAFLIPLIIFVYFVATGRGIRFLFTKRFALFWGLGILIVAPWIIYMSLRFGSYFWDSFFGFSGITRASTPIEGHIGDYLFYFNYLVNNDNLFWIILLPFSAGLCAFNAVIKRLKQDTLILAWMTIVLLVFTLIQTKLEWYILPAFPAFAIAISSFLYEIAKKIPVITSSLLLKAQDIVELATQR